MIPSPVADTRGGDAPAQLRATPIAGSDQLAGDSRARSRLIARVRGFVAPFSMRTERDDIWVSGPRPARALRSFRISVADRGPRAFARALMARYGRGGHSERPNRPRRDQESDAPLGECIFVLGSREWTRPPWQKGRVGNRPSRGPVSLALVPVTRVWQRKSMFSSCAASRAR